MAVFYKSIFISCYKAWTEIFGCLCWQVYEYDDFYFLTDPEQLIYSHWAHRSEWQLLVRPITLADFENLPLVKSYFFKCGMFFVSHHNGVVETKKGNCIISCIVDITDFSILFTHQINNFHMGFLFLLVCGCFFKQAISFWNYQMLVDI